MQGSIVVGVGGTGGYQALAWAAEEADRTGVPLLLVHVCASTSPLERTTREPATAEVELADPVLGRALAETRTRLGGQRVALRAHSGDPATRLIDASADAGLLVIGAGGGGRTVRRVLRHAPCPIVVVRPSRHGGTAPLAGHVVVGLDGSPGEGAAAGFAFAYAAAHHFPLAAVHVLAESRDDYFYDETTLSTHFVTEPRALEMLADQVEPWALKYPAVPIRRAVLAGSAAERLIQAGAGARLLVVGDKRRGPIGRTRTGDLPLTVAAGARCPVAVVPLDRQEREPL